MAMLRFGSAFVADTEINNDLWSKSVCCGNKDKHSCGEGKCRVKIAKNVFAKYTPEKYLLSHCFPAGHQVLMADGTERPIESVNTGDLVITHKGNIRPVTKILSRKVEENLTVIKSASLPEVSCTGEHPFYVIKRADAWCKVFPFYAKSESVKCTFGGKQICKKYTCLTNGANPDWVKARNIKEGDRTYTPSLHETHVDKDLNPNRLRLLGYYVAEGRVDNQKGTNSRLYMIRFSINQSEMSTMGAEIIQLMKMEFGIGTHSLIRNKKRLDKGVTLSFHSFQHAPWFLYHAGCGEKEKKLSSEIMTSPMSWQKQLIGSWLNGDGSYSKKINKWSSKGIRLSTASKDLASQAVVILDRLEIHSILRRILPLKKQRKEGPYSYIPPFDGWHICISNTYAKEIDSVVQWSIQENEFKKISTKERYRYAASTLSVVKSVSEKSFSGIVYNLSVKEDESYIINRQAVHNCTIIAAVDTELANPSDPKSDYYIHPSFSKYVNNNGDAWSKQMLASCYRSFIGSHNYLEHVQIPELSKGRVIDAILREVPVGRDKEGKELTTYYVDILVATERKHKQLISDIISKKLSSLSMGCKISFSVCTKCGKRAVDETESCQHVRFEKNNTFYDGNGVQRKVAELCGHSSEPESVTFIDASWVKSPAFIGAVIRNIVNPPENILAKIEEASKKEGYLIQKDDFLKAAYKTAQKEEETPPPEEEAPPPEEETSPPEEETPPEGGVTPEEAPPEVPGMEIDQNNIKTWKDEVKKKVLQELGDELVEDINEEDDQGPRELETLDDSLIHPTASQALERLWVLKEGWNKFLEKTTNGLSKENYDRLKFGTFIILNSEDPKVLVDYGYRRRDFLAVMSYLDKCFKNPLSMNVKKAVAELNGTKGLSLEKAIFSLQKLAGQKLAEKDIRKSLVWLKLMDLYQE